MEVENVRGSSLEERSATAGNAPTLLVASRIMVRTIIVALSIDAAGPPSKSANPADNPHFFMELGVR